MAVQNYNQKTRFISNISGIYKKIIELYESNYSLLDSIGKYKTKDYTCYTVQVDKDLYFEIKDSKEYSPFILIESCKVEKSIYNKKNIVEYIETKIKSKEFLSKIKIIENKLG